MTFLELRNLAATWLDDPNKEYFTDTILKVFINNAQKETQKELVAKGQDWYVKCAETVMLVNQQQYQFPNDFVKVAKLKKVMQGTGANTIYANIEPITRSQMDEFDTPVGEPLGYFLDHSYINLVPIPNVARVLHLEYSYLVADMAADLDLPDVPIQYHEYLAVLATLDGLNQDGRDPSGMLKKQEYYKMLMDKDAQQRKIDRPRMVNRASQFRYGGY